MTGTEAANTLDTEVNKTRDYIAQRTAAVTPVDKGGTGATTAAGARTALGVPATAHTHLISSVYATDGTTPYSTALQAALDAMSAVTATKVAKTGDTMSGDLYLPASSAASSGWTAAYINGDGRVCRGASSLRYKKYVSEVEPSAFGNIFKPLNRFQMRGGDGRWTYGHIAEVLAEDPDTERFVMYDAEGRPDSVDYVPLLLAKVEQLNARLEALEGAAG